MIKNQQNALRTLWLSFCLLFSTMAFALDKDISGKVTDDKGDGIPGVSVAIKGTNKGTTTDADGNYRISVANGNTVLVFSAVGYDKTEQTVGNQSIINVQLASNAAALDEVVVTALGVKRDRKTLTYAAQQISSQDFRAAGNINVMESLSGKVAGAQIERGNSGAGGSTKVVLRGNKSLTNDSEPLYVIDGIPMVNNKTSQPGMWGGTDRGDGFSQVNPEDIESINVLKGANASILYGSAGANGVILINTKKGATGRTTVNITSNFNTENVMNLPNLQFRYGADKGDKESWSYQKGNYNDSFVKDFFQTGMTSSNGVSISGGNAKTTTFFSYNNISSRGVIENNKYGKHNISFRQSTKLLKDKLTLSSNVMLADERAKNRYAAGYYLNPLTGLYFFPRERDFESYRNYETFNQTRNLNLMNWFVTDHHQSNPFWLLNNQPATDVVKRLIGSASVDYKIDDHFSILVRGNVDFANKKYDQQFLAGGNGTNIGQNGRYALQVANDQQLYTDAMLKYDRNMGDISLNSFIGTSYVNYNSEGITADNGTQDLFYPNFFAMQNMQANTLKSQFMNRRIKKGLFANTTWGYKEFLFLDLSGRRDWASTLVNTQNPAYNYYAAGVSAIISHMMDMPKFISFAKVRASTSSTANEVPFNVVEPQNQITNGTTGGISYNKTKPFNDLKPENIQSNEAGLDLRFLNGRLGFDLTLYKNISTNQFLRVSAPSGSGYDYLNLNVGKIVNKGFELTISGEPFRMTNFGWNTAVNISRNTNKVEELLKEDPNYRFELGSSEGYFSRIIAGGAFGDLYGYGFRRNASGQVELDPTTSSPLKTKDPVLLGNLLPKFIIGWNNNFNLPYNLSLNLQINGKIGGNVVSQTEAMLDGYGVSERTAAARDLGYVEINGIRGTEAVTKVDPKTYYKAIGDRNGILEPYVYSRTNVKLQQLALSYGLKPAALHLPVSAASISLVGQNLLYLYKVAPFDPELAMSTNKNSQSLDNFNMPATRFLGMKLNLTF